MTSPRPLILHDFFNAPDGGGKVAAILARSFDAELWTGDLNREAFPPGYFKGVTPKSLNAYGTASFWLGFSKICRLWWAFSHFPKTSTDWSIYSGSFSPLAHKRISGFKIYYCLTPPRILYDQREFILERVPLWQRPFLMGLMHFYRVGYEHAIRHMDRTVTISLTVRRRFQEYLGHDSQVIYPPCEIDRFRWIEAGDFYLSTARVDPLKRVELIVRAFKNMPDRRLVVVSGGSDLPKIKKIADEASNIHVLGWVDEARLEDLMGRCIGTVYIPREEDFGISPVESMAAGKPVIGVQEGGVIETVGDGDMVPKGARTVHDGPKERLRVTNCGILIAPEPQEEDIMEAVKWLTPERAQQMRASCEKKARRFSTQVFLENMQEIIEGMMGRE